MGKTVTSRFVLKGDNQLNSAFSKAKKQMGDMGRTAGLMGAAAVAGGVALVRAQAQSIDEMAKTADVVGVTTEALQELRYAAELNGISNKGMDDSLKRLNRRAGEFANSGGGPAAKAFEQLGIQVTDASGKMKGTEELFNEITQEMQGIESDAQKAALAAQLFGDDFGPKLVPLINQGVTGIEEARETLRSLGLTISESEAAGVERMNDAMTTAGQIGSGLAAKFTAELAPAVAAIVEQFVEASEESGGLGESAIDAADVVIEGMGWVMDAVDTVKDSFQIAGNVGIIAFENTKMKVVELADTIVNGPNRATNELIELLNKLPGIDIDYRFAPIAEGLQVDINQSLAIIDEAAAEIDSILLSGKPSEAFKGRVARIREELKAAAAEVAGEVAETTEAVVSAVADPEPVQEFTESLKDAASAIKDVSDSQEFSTGLQGVSSDVTDLLMSFREGSDAAKLSFKSFIDSMISDAIRAMAQNAVQALLGGFSGGGGFGGILSSIFGGFFADGGNFYAGKPIIVGEHGPEAIMPRASGTVVPNHQMGGNNVTVNIDARQSDDPARILALTPIIEARVIDAITLRSRRGLI